MAESRLGFLKKAFQNYRVHIRGDGLHANIFNPFYDENVDVYYHEEDSHTPFLAYFSYQRCSTAI